MPSRQGHKHTCALWSMTLTGFPSVSRQLCLSTGYKALQKAGLTPNTAEMMQGYQARLIRCPALGGLGLIP